MGFFSRLGGLFSRGGNNELQRSMEKALAMKQEAETGANIPPHHTPHDGMRPANDPHMSDAMRGAEAGFTPQLKRSRVARSGDT